MEFFLQNQARSSISDHIAFAFSVSCVDRLHQLLGPKSRSAVYGLLVCECAVVRHSVVVLEKLCLQGFTQQGHPDERFPSMIRMMSKRPGHHHMHNQLFGKQV